MAKELGHGGDALVRRVYGHLGTTRHRADVVEYRVESFREQLTERLALLRGAIGGVSDGSRPIATDCEEAA